MFDDLRADLNRFTALSNLSGLAKWKSLLETQGVWAVSVYRFGRWVYGDAPRPVAIPCKAIYQVAHKLIEITTGINVPASAQIGRGLYIGHFGGIVVHSRAVLGENCSLSQGVTIGVLGGAREGVPRIGNDVYLGAGAKVLGELSIGDGARIGANAVVLKDVPAHATAVGVPAQILLGLARCRPTPSSRTG